jgi:hypothetical protein
MFAEIEQIPEVSKALFDILETQRIVAGHAKLRLLPSGVPTGGLAALLASNRTDEPEPPPLTR